MIWRFFRDCRGASTAEYALILAIIGAGVGAAALALGSNVAFAIADDAGAIYALNEAS